MSDIFLILCFLSLKRELLKLDKKCLFQCSRALFVFEVLEFLNLRILNFMASSNTYVLNKKYILLNKWVHKPGLTMKLGQFM